MKYEIKKIAEKIYVIEFEKQYDLCMFFCRYQEFYESPNPQFRGQAFDMFDFMEWYASEYGNGLFTYPTDWIGFNLSSKIIDEVQSSGIYSKSKYDYEMMMVHKYIKEECDNYYLIGMSKNKNNQSTLAHEVAHALFATDLLYKARMENMIDSLDKKLSKKICSWLEEIGYAETVFIDEMQAYIATGMPKSSRIHIPKKIYKPFLELYKHFIENIIELKDWKR